MDDINIINTEDKLDNLLSIMKTYKEDLDLMKAGTSSTPQPTMQNTPPHIIRQEKLEKDLKLLPKDLQAACTWLRAALHEDRRSDLYHANKEKEPGVKRGGGSRTNHN